MFTEYQSGDDSFLAENARFAGFGSGNEGASSNTTRGMLPDCGAMMPGRTLRLTAQPSFY